MSTNSKEDSDGVEKILKYLEVSGKLMSFIVPSAHPSIGDLLSELLYAAGNYAAIVRDFYRRGQLRAALLHNTAAFVRKSLETFEVVIECCAYRLGSKQWKWTAIVCTQVLKLALRLYLTHAKAVVLEATVAGRGCGLPATCTCGDHLCPNHTVLSETLHSARPLLHTCLYLRHGSASWLPWLCAAFADLLSVSCVPNRSCLSRQQAACYWARVRGLAAYLVRTPFHDKVAAALVAWLAAWPLPGLRKLFGLLLTYMAYWRLYYFNMWG